MKNMQLFNRSGLAAIAAATALLSTPALAQDAAPGTADPAPIVADEPLTIEPLPTPEPAPEPAGDTLAPVASEPVARATRPTRATTAPSGRAPAPSALTAADTSTAAPEAVAATPIAPASDALPADPAMVAPLPEPVAAAPADPAGDSAMTDDVLPIAGAAGLGILALAGAGFALRRRRRTVEDVLVEDNWHEQAMSRASPAVDPSPVVATPVAASAFNWGDARSVPVASQAPVAASAPVNRIEAAKRGPTPDNPSLSLKKRLKRAAFFDQRDRQIAAGTGTPIMADAGLPDALTPVTPATSRPSTDPVRRPMPAMNMSYGKTFQPA